MAERASMPLFVPRTVATFERAATRVAWRVAGPARALATRALSFADRVFGSWADAGATAAERPAMRVAARGGGLVLPRPWYELGAADADGAPAAGAGAGARAGATTGSGAKAPDAPKPAAAAAARGAAIARTTLTAAPEPAATARGEERHPAAASSRTSETDVDGGAAVAAVDDDVRAVEALGLAPTQAEVAPAVSYAAPPRRPVTPLARALAHTAWADAQLRLASAPPPTLVRADAGYVFVAPAAVEAPPARARGVATAVPPAGVAPTGVPATTEAATGGPPAVLPPTAVPPGIVPAPSAAAPTALSPAVAAAPVAPAGWTAALPDPRLAVAVPAMLAERVAAFVARLVGAQAERDAAPIAAVSPASSEPGAAAIATASVRAPAQAFVAWTPVTPRAIAEAPVVTAAAAAGPVRTWRPGAAAARSEQLGVSVDARAAAVWGESPPAAGPASRGAVEWAYVAPGVVEEPARATGPARLARFMDGLVGVQAVRAAAPLPLPIVAAADARPGGGAATATAASEPAPAWGVLVAPAPPPLGAAARFAPGGIGLRTEQLGSLVGVRAASLSIDFVDPARLAVAGGAAPALPPVVAAVAAQEPPAGEPLMPAPLMPAPRPLLAAPARSGMPALTAEEWSLVATFPSTATAVQMVAARQAAEWQPDRALARAAQRPLVVATGPRVDVAPGDPARVGEGAGLRAARATGIGREPGTAEPFVASAGGAMSAGDAAMAAGGAAVSAAARAPVPAEYVVPVVADAAAARLPGGRTPRGGFLWPRAATLVGPAQAWAPPPVVVVAEQAAQAAPGTPLWGALPSLVTVSPSLAASAGIDAGTPGASLRAAAPPAGAASAKGGTLRGDVAAAGGEPTAGGAPELTLMTAGPRGATGEATGRAGAGRAPARALPTGEAARALELARPFLQLVGGGGDAEAPRPSTPRFYEQPQPLVSAVPSSDAASRIVEALRAQPAATPSDDRVTLADLTLIAIASATQQVAASPAGGGPGAAPPPAAATPAPASSGAPAEKPGNPTQDIEELARAAFDELQRLIAIARERSGDHG